MKVTPALRRAVHQAADLILDALAADDEKPPVRRRGPAPPRIEPLDPDKLPPHLREQLDRQMTRNGYRRT